MSESPLRVLKVGGRELVPGPALGRLVLAVARWVRRGTRVVLVHGGGEEVTARAEALGLPTVRRDGQRVTDAAMLEVVAEVLSGRVNLRLVHALAGAGVPALGLTGVSGGLLRVRPAEGLGWVGLPTRVRPRLLERLVEDGLTPVVAPLGTDGTGGVYNVNADLAAAALAGALGGELVLLTDVEAVRGETAAPVPLLRPSEARSLVRRGVARDGMIPKLEATLLALEGGAVSAWIGSLAGLDDDGPRDGAGTRVIRPSARPVPASSPPLGGTAR